MFGTLSQSSGLRRTIPIRGTGWSPLDRIWCGNGPVATGWKQSVPPLLSKSSEMGLLGRQDDIVVFADRVGFASDLSGLLVELEKS